MAKKHFAASLCNRRVAVDGRQESRFPYWVIAPRDRFLGSRTLEFRSMFHSKLNLKLLGMNVVETKEEGKPEQTAD